MPARTFSPGLLARTNIASSCCRDVAGKPAMRLNVSVTEPSLPVGCSDGIENCWNGTAVAWTFAPETGSPHVSETCTVIWKLCTPDVITPGLELNDAI